MYTYRRISGFTLIELVIVMTIIAVIALLASNIPDSLIDRRQTAITTASLFTLMTFSRNQAIHLSSQVIVCPSIDDRDCINDWNNRIISFVDTNHNSRRDNNEHIYFRHVTHASVTVSYSRNTRFLRFNPTGSIYPNGSFFICPVSSDNRLAHALVINRQGRTRQTTDSNNDGITEDANGVNLNC